MMKNLIPFLALLFFLTSCASKKKLAQAKITFIEGSNLFYEVRMGGEKYNFDLNINEFSDDVISFDWEMGGERSGTIAMNNPSLSNATSLFNYFSGGYKLLKNQTSVWLSKQLFKDLKSGKAVEIDLGNGNKEIFKYQEPETFSFGNKGDGVPHNIPVIVIANEDASKEIWIMNDPQNRLIVMMNLDFRIDLVDWKL